MDLVAKMRFLIYLVLEGSRNMSRMCALYCSQIIL
ncbi:Uncharacterised protein [Vibrio cholerae]|nr:Uncharacterised protein [Vibrio cholerae]